MSPSDATRTLKRADLSVTAQRALRSRVLAGRYDVHALTDVLSELEQWDLQLESRRTWTRRLFVGSIIAAFVGLVGWLARLEMHGALNIGLLMLLLSVTAGVVIHRSLKALRDADVPNEVRSVIRPMLRQLQHDLRPQARIATTINLTVMNQSQGTKTTLRPIGPERERELTEYTQAVCDIRMPLADGSTAELRVTNTYRRLFRYYRTSRNYKSKIKWTKLSTATVVLVPARPVSWEPAAVQPFMDDTREKLSFPVSNGISAARLDRYYKFKTVSYPPEATLPGEDVVALFVRLCAMHPLAAGPAQ